MTTPTDFGLFGLRARMLPIGVYLDGTIGDFWQPILDRVREVERGHASRWGESSDPLVHQAPTPAEAAQFLAARFARSTSQGKEN